MAATLIGLTTGAVAHDRVDRLAEKIGLFEDQVPQVKAAFEEATAMRRTQRESGQDVGHGAVRELVREKLLLILTTEQMERFDTLQYERRSKRHRGRHGNRRTE